ncbi:D-glycero-alpha-D-manno-heptose 1-phosphate guanylyltransferase [Pseudovibrio axinellae]|uniref:D-glycero-alpha-D-manno-heptose 1-phosphate guanylyltransferase n=1 Tax=Pseudovibrio axinellae TaxID=989403 RepID=A0A165ZZJ0_9HYPH|nr:nucleotidyltransferase family protein [Pseudovibrio axinellae]KZL20463.1 D-glycero-alpha-D-manno-heptose 1-phosphate guanylyltransferase [Pseudovibrio axinellae]SEQ38061.1 MurNAc alpha-1-phosphate uridylyltransferase [Pseudovibrio axinellae]
MPKETSFHPKAAMVLSAGLGKRMRPLTATTPKPLIEVDGKSMLARAASRLKDAGLETCVVNVHYLADLVESHALKFEGLDVKISDERDELLDTGGGIKKALPMLGTEPFILKNSDSFWLEGVKPNLDLLVETWDDNTMDILLLMSPTVNAVGYNGKGDFLMGDEGKLERRDERSVAPYIYSGTAMIHPRLFNDTPEGPFSLNVLFDKAIASGRLHGVEGDGLWLHVGTPEGLDDAEQAIANSAN